MSSITLRFLAGPGTANSGGKVPGGTVMGWIDEAGLACATHWSRRECVMVAIGSIHFGRPIMTGDLVEVEARLAYTGQASMNMAIEVRAGDMKAAHMEKITECVAVFVAITPDGQTVPVNAWRAGTPSDMALAQYVKNHLDLARASQPAA